MTSGNFLFIFWILFANPNEINVDPAKVIYDNLDSRKPSRELFSLAYKGYLNVKKNHEINLRKPYITIIDFNLPSNKKRLWVIDLKDKEILYHTYVAHGRNSGQLYARDFSNKKGSFKSSLGFYITDKTYIGRNGYSMYLSGIEKNINDKARERAIVSRIR